MGRLKLTRRLKPSIVSEGPLQYYAAEQTVLFFQTPAARVKLCRIIFDRNDGGIYVDFPYHVSKEGLLSEITFESSDVVGATGELRRKGTAFVTTDVKFAHHPSGMVHFSKTGKAERLPRRYAFPLATTIGRIFEVHVFWLQGLKDLDQIKSRDLHIGFRFEDVTVQSIKLRAQWRRKRDIVDHRTNPNEVIGPASRAIERSNGSVHMFRLLGQPRGFPLRENLLMLEADWCLCQTEQIAPPFYSSAGGTTTSGCSTNLVRRRTPASRSCTLPTVHRPTPRENQARPAQQPIRYVADANQPMEMPWQTSTGGHGSDCSSPCWRAGRGSRPAAHPRRLAPRVTAQLRSSSTRRPRRAPRATPCSCTGAAEGRGGIPPEDLPRLHGRRRRLRVHRRHLERRTV